MAENTEKPAENAANVAQKAEEKPAKKSKLGLILGLSIGGGVVVLAGIIILIVVLLNSVSKKDWQTAQSKIGAMQSSYDDQSSTISSDVDDMTSAATNGDSDINSKISTVTNDISSYRSTLKNQINALGEMRAIKLDKTANQKFAKVESAYKKYDADLAKASAIYSKVMPLFGQMIALGQNTSGISSVADAQNIANEFTSLAAKMSATKTGYSDVDASVAKMATDMKAVGDGLNSMISSGSADTTAVDDATTNLSSDASDFSTSMEGDNTSNDESNFISALQDLQSYVDNKAK